MSTGQERRRLVIAVTVPVVWFLGLLIIAVVVAGAIWWQRDSRRARPRPRQPAQPPAPQSGLFEYEAEVARFQREAETELERTMPQMEADAARLQAETMRDIEREQEMWDRQTTKDAEPDPPPTVRRSDYVPKDDEWRYLTRDKDGSPTMRLVDAGDRLAIWSTAVGSSTRGVSACGGWVCTRPGRVDLSTTRGPTGPPTSVWAGGSL